MREMKDSGVAWIGEIPSNWRIRTIGSLFQCRNEKVNDTDYPPLSISKGGVVPQMENVAKSDANDNRKQVLKNDFVINSRSDRKQSCGVSNLDGSVSLINTVLFEKEECTIVPSYNNYLLKNYGFAEEFYRWGHGIVADLWTTRWQEMKNIDLPIPSYQEQETILKDIEAKSKKVDKLIANQEQQIEKLKAYKQSLITEVVTKGLNPDAPMKDSGVEWIGDIPESWDIIQFKYLHNGLNTGEGLDKEFWSNDDKDIVFYTAGLEPIRTTYQGFPDWKYTEFNDLLLSRNGTPYVFLPMAGACYTDHVIRAKLKNGINRKFVQYCLQQSILTVVVDSVSLATWSASLWNKQIITWPSPTEQSQIADYLDEKCEAIDRLIEIKQQKIEKLNEYKKSLIYEYVTGKKEV